MSFRFYLMSAYEWSPDILHAESLTERNYGELIDLIFVPDLTT